MNLKPEPSLNAVKALKVRSNERIGKIFDDIFEQSMEIIAEEMTKESPKCAKIKPVGSEMSPKIMAKKSVKK